MIALFCCILLFILVLEPEDSDNLEKFIVFNKTRRSCSAQKKDQFARYYNYGMNSLDYRYNNEHLCHNGTRLLIMIESRPSKFKSRLIIRSTWGSLSNENISIAFILGKIDYSDRSRDIELNLKHESDTYCDIIQDISFMDNYFNLVLKSQSLIKWTSVFCNNTKGLFKTDDDMWINVKSLYELSELLNPGMYGYLHHNSIPQRVGSRKYFTPISLFNGTKYPDYLSGGGYLIISRSNGSSNLSMFRSIYEMSKLTPLINMEDVYITGFIAQKLDIKRYHLIEFNYQKIAINKCRYSRLISSHNISENEMYKLWYWMSSGKLKCSLPFSF